MRSPESGSAHGPEVLCTGIAVLDAVFRVAQFPVPQAKTQASEFLIISGGCAANAAIAIARLGGRARFAGPLGGAGRRGPDRRPDRGGARGRAGGHRRLRAGAGRRVLDVGDLHRSARRARHRQLPRRPARRRPAGRSRRHGGDRRRGTGRQPLSGVRAADLRGRAGARHPGRARRRQADPGDRRPADARLPCGVLRRGAARHRRHQRSRRRPRPDGGRHAARSWP